LCGGLEGLVIKQAELVDRDALGLSTEQAADEGIHSLSDVLELRVKPGLRTGLFGFEVDQRRRQLCIVSFGPCLCCFEVDQGGR